MFDIILRINCMYLRKLIHYCNVVAMCKKIFFFQVLLCSELSLNIKLSYEKTTCANCELLRREKEAPVAT